MVSTVRYVATLAGGGACVVLLALGLGCSRRAEQLGQQAGLVTLAPLPPAEPPSATRTDDALLEQIATTLEFRLGRPSGIWIAPDGKEVLFRRSPPRSFVADLYAFDVATGTERTLLRAETPVTDWRNYDTHYTERYLGLLSDSTAPYDATGAVKNAAELTRPLLLVHGTTDDNVYFTHSLELAQALFRAGKPFDMLPLAGFTHMVPDPVVKKALAHRVYDFFRQHLGAPRSEP